MTTDRERVRERILFGVLVLLQAGFYAWLLLTRRMVKTHDTSYIYQVQYLFLAHACAGPDLALWFPYSMHGVASNLFANGQGSLFPNILLLLGGVPAGTPAIPLFYAGIYLEELILLTGVWGLGRRYYASPYTRFFVAAAALGSSFWASQIFFNHRLFYAIPLLLSLLHGYLEEGRRGDLLLAALLGALQFSGSAIYLPVFVVIVVAAYFVSHALLHRAFWAAKLRQLRPRLPDLAIVALFAVLVIAIVGSLSEGSSAFRQVRTGRNPDSSVTLDAFLTFATTLKPTRYLDFFLGISPSMDVTLYCGLAPLAFAAAALAARPGKPVLHLLICILLLLLFTTGYLSLVGAVTYQGVPPMRYFRYVGMMSPLVRLFVILLAGYGFDALVSGRLDVARFARGTAAGCAVVALVALAGLTREGQNVLADFFRSGSADVANRPAVLGAFPVATLAGTGAAAVAFAALLLLRGRARFVPLLLVLQTVDVYRWKIQMFRDETATLDEAQYALHRVAPLPYLARRADYPTSDRYRTMEPVLFDYGARYDLIDGFAHLDPPATRFRFNYWLAPFEALIQAQDRRPLDHRLDRPARLQPFRPGDPYAKVVGMTEDKIRIFRRAHVAASDQAAADLMNSPGFRGDVLLLSPRPGIATEELGPQLGSADERVRTNVRVLGFDANSASIGVTVPDGGWLSYADVWDGGWTATVNGKPATVERSFLAYKAVRLEPGVNFVHFRYESPFRVWSHRLIALASLFCVLGILVHGFRLFAPQK